MTEYSEGNDAVSMVRDNGKFKRKNVQEGRINMKRDRDRNKYLEKNKKQYTNYMKENLKEKRMKKRKR